MVSIEPIRVQVEREQDGRILASVPELPGVMAYGGFEEEAIRRVKAVALQVMAEMIESGEALPSSLQLLFAALASGKRLSPDEFTQPCCILAGR